MKIPKKLTSLCLLFALALFCISLLPVDVDAANYSGFTYSAANNETPQTGWVKDGESWYYLSESGAMKTGWLKDGETWYYLSESGAMKTGWVKIGADWFYMN